MGRKKIKLDDPTDPEQVRAHIELKAKHSESKLLKELLHSLPSPIRLPLFREEYNAHEFDLQGFTRFTAAAVHLRGEIAKIPCGNCLQGKGPFHDCIFLSGFDELTKMCCTNCSYHLLTSTAHSETKKSGCSFAKG